MQRELLKFGGGPLETIVNPLVLSVVLIAGVLMVVLPRNKAIIPFLTTAILIPTDQIIVLGSLHFMMLRVLILFGIVVLLRSKSAPKGIVFSGGMNTIDSVVIMYTVFTAIAWVLLWQEMPTVIYQLGGMYTNLGTYVLLRCLIRDSDDIVVTTRTFAFIAIVIAVIMTYEHLAGTNPYAALGGARESFYASLMERDGRLRATASFGHPILAGTFGGVMLPLLVGLWWSGRKHRTVAVAGILAVTGIVIACNSSTPLLAYVAGVTGLVLWPLRNQMRLIRWSIVLTLVSLHMVMKAPVWHLISRIDLVGGSSGYHRYELVNQCIRHFSDWWLVGVKNNGQWGWNMWDTANQYVATAQSAGLLPFTLFVSIIVYGFKYAGKTRRIATNRKDALFLWSLGSALFAQAVGFFGVSYFDQSIVVWYALLACISAGITMPHTASLQRRPGARDCLLQDSTAEPAFAN